MTCQMRPVIAIVLNGPLGPMSAKSVKLSTTFFADPKIGVKARL
jgi:hypothetical protein